MTLTFKGGFHPEENKSLTEGKAVIKFDAPKELVIPLSQHIGAPCSPLVKAGDTVTVGQKIGDSDAYVSVPVHSSVSGVVKAVEKRPHSVQGECMAIVIENDGEYTVCPDVKPVSVDGLTKEEIIKHIREAGIVGMGGATFPAHVKLNVPADKKIDTVIINGAECEPFLTADHRLMLENPEAVAEGLKIILKVVGINNGIIAVEDNKKDAFLKIKEVCDKKDGIKAVLVKTKYPQGSEKQLISSVLKREVKSGTLPADSGVVVVNVATAAEIYNYFRTGMPLIGRIVTVSGSGVKNPVNLYVKIGTHFSEIAEYAGLKEGIKKVLAGGPMMGIAQYSLDVPVMKGTSGILFLTEKEDKEFEEGSCIRCGKCVDHCPIKLMPFMITEYARINDLDNAVKYGLKDCIECGTCSFVCPQRRYLVQSIRTAKSKLPRK